MFFQLFLTLLSKIYFFLFRFSIVAFLRIFSAEPNENGRLFRTDFKIPKSIDNVFTEDEKLYYMSHRNKFCTYLRQEMVTFYTQHPMVFKSMISGIYFRTIVPFESIGLLEEFMLKSHTKYFLSSSDIDGVPISDKKALAESNTSTLITTFQSILLGKTLSKIDSKEIRVF